MHENAKKVLAFLIVWVLLLTFAVWTGKSWMDEMILIGLSSSMLVCIVTAYFGGKILGWWK